MSRQQIRGRLALPVRELRGLTVRGRSLSLRKKIWCARRLSFLAPLLGFGGFAANGCGAEMRTV